MRRNRVSKNDAIIGGAKEVFKEFQPLYQKRASRFKRYAKSHPYQLLIIMGVIVILNFTAALVIDIHTRHASMLADISKVQLGKSDSLSASGDINTQLSTPPPIPMSLSNVEEILKMRSELKYLMNKSHLNHADSVLFIQIVDQYSKIDTSFISLLEKISNHDH